MPALEDFCRRFFVFALLVTRSTACHAQAYTCNTVNLMIIITAAGVTTRFATYHVAALATLLAVVFLASPCFAIVTHQYRLDGSFADDLGGPGARPGGRHLGADQLFFWPQPRIVAQQRLVRPGQLFHRNDL